MQSRHAVVRAHMHATAAATHCKSKLTFIDRRQARSSMQLAQQRLCLRACVWQGRQQSSPIMASVPVSCMICSCKPITDWQSAPCGATRPGRRTRCCCSCSIVPICRPTTPHWAAGRQYMGGEPDGRPCGASMALSVSVPEADGLVCLAGEFSVAAFSRVVNHNDDSSAMKHSQAPSTAGWE